MDRIKELKCEVFDIIAAQEFHRSKFTELEQEKMKKLKEMEEIQKNSTADIPKE